MLLVRKRLQNSSANVRKYLLPLQLVETPAADTIESGGNNDQLESWQMQTRAAL